MTGMDLLPAPVRVVRHDVPDEDGRFVLTRHTVLDAAPDTGRTARWLRSVLGAAFGVDLPAGTGGDVLRLRTDPAMDPEAYRIEVAPHTAVITGGTGAGVFWGAQTLRQLLGADAFRRAPVRGDAGALPVPPVTIEDAPRFGWRGFMLDVARHFMPKDVRTALPRPDGRPQAQRAAPAPDRRPGLAGGDRRATRG